MRRPSWADMESSSDEDEEEDEDDEMAAAGATTENPWKTHTKRKAQGAPQGAPEKHKPRLG